MELKGIHHISAHTADASKNYDFYTHILGMRLVKKTVNQDSPSMYHLFYADEIGNPGTDLTFFEIPMLATTHRGTNSISNTSLRVPTDASLTYWRHRFEAYGVSHQQITERAGHAVLDFQDHENMPLTLISDENNQGVPAGKPWEHSPVPAEHAITGLGPVTLTVHHAEKTAHTLTDVLNYKHTRTYTAPDNKASSLLVFETGEGGNGSEIHLYERRDLPPERPGRGSVHHVAYRVQDIEALKQWLNKLEHEQIANSGIVDRYYFQSIYFKEPHGIVFELATDGPGFTTDEPSNHLGERLALPPFLENKREKIERRLKPIQSRFE